MMLSSTTSIFSMSGLREKPLEFFNFDCVSDLKEIKSDGTLIFDGDFLGGDFGCDMTGLISNGDFNTSDIIALLNELRNL